MVTLTPEDYTQAPEETTVQQTVVAALSHGAGTALAQVLSAWMESGGTKFTKVHLLGPAGTVVKLTIVAETAQVTQGAA